MAQRLAQLLRSVQAGSFCGDFFLDFQELIYLGKKVLMMREVCVSTVHQSSKKHGVLQIRILHLRKLLQSYISLGQLFFYKTQGASLEHSFGSTRFDCGTSPTKTEIGI